jgi:hypothetical protein
MPFFLKAIQNANFSLKTASSHGSALSWHCFEMLEWTFVQRRGLWRFVIHAGLMWVMRHSAAAVVQRSRRQELPLWTIGASVAVRAYRMACASAAVGHLPRSKALRLRKQAYSSR